MLPLNYAILKYFTTVEEACATDVIEALMTAEKNGLLEETRCELNDADELEVYYHAHEEGRATINKYIK